MMKEEGSLDLETDNDNDKDDEIPMVPSLSPKKNNDDVFFRFPRDDGSKDDSNDEIMTRKSDTTSNSNMCDRSRNRSIDTIEIPSSLKARLECGDLVVDTTSTSTGLVESETATVGWRHGVSASESYHGDGYDVDVDVAMDDDHRSFYTTSKQESPPTSRKMSVKLDDSKTPTAALSVGGNGGGRNTPMDFEILPDESDDDDFEGDDNDDDNDNDDDRDGDNDGDNDGDGNDSSDNDNSSCSSRRRSKKEGFQESTNRIEESDVRVDMDIGMGLDIGMDIGMDIVKDDFAHSNKRRSSDEEINSSTSPTNINTDIRLPDSLAIPSDSSDHKPLNRRRFLFAPKSPRSQSTVLNFNNKLNSFQNNASTVSDMTGNNNATGAQLESEKPRRLTTMIRKIKASRKENRKYEVQDNAKNSVALAAAGTADINMVESGLEEQDSSSDESSFDDDENWSDEESQLFDDGIDQPIDCSALHTSLPKSFLDLPPDIYDYLDSDLVTEIESQDVSTYAWEHHLFVKGLLQLLAERDLIGVEDDVFDAHNVSKMGVLRKKDAKIGWRVKYVEVRKGNLTYFDNKGNEKGRTIHLRKRRCVCRITSNKEGGQDFIFELVVDGGRRLLWTAQSEEECQGWVRAINQAMIGEVDDSRDIPLDLSLYRNDIVDYQTMHSSLKEVHTRQEYLVAMNTLLYRQTSSSALRVPMKWIRDYFFKEESKEEPMKDNERIKHVVREFWKNLCNTSVVLNGHLVQSDGIYSGERVIGALSRCILEFDKVENTKDFDQIFNSLKRSRREGNYSITELQAVSYARNILNGSLRSSSKGDMKAAVEELFRNENVAYAKLESSEPLHIYVSYGGDDFSESKPRPTEFVGWIETKSKKSKKWKMRYFVLSEGVLSYFERANPRPYRLSGQMVLRDAKIKNLEGNMLSLVAQSQERLLRFSDRGELIKWKSIMNDKGSNVDALIEQDHEKNEVAQKNLEKMEAEKDLEKKETQKYGSDEEQLPEAATKEDNLTPSRERSSVAYSDENMANGKSLGRVRGAGAKFLKKAALAKKRAKDRTGARMKSIRTGAGLFIRGVRGNSNSEETMGRRPTNDMLISSTRHLNCLSEKRQPTVQAVVEMNSTFKVMSKHTSNGDDKEEEILL
jgi:hypothetical protein